MQTKEKLEQYLSRCMDSACDFAEIFEEFEENEMISTLDQKVEKAERQIISGLGVRLYRGVQSVYGYTNEILPLIDDLRAAIAEKAEDGAEDAAPAEKKPVVLTRVEYETRHPVKTDYRKVPLQEKAELVFRAEKAAKESDERIVKTTGKLLNVREEV